MAAYNWLHKEHPQPDHHHSWINQTLWVLQRCFCADYVCSYNCLCWTDKWKPWVPSDVSFHSIVIQVYRLFEQHMRHDNITIGLYSTLKKSEDVLTKNITDLRNHWPFFLRALSMNCAAGLKKGRRLNSGWSAASTPWYSTSRSL